MLTKKIVVGIVRTNCYIVALEDRTDCVVIDPGDEAKRILQETDGRQIAAILFTHGHFDHIGAGEDLVTAAGQAGGPKICIHREDEPMLKNGKLNASQVFFRKAILGPKATDLLEDGDTVREAGLTFQVIHTPGHTRGSVCYLCGDLPQQRDQGKGYCR